MISYRYQRFLLIFLVVILSPLTMAFTACWKKMPLMTSAGRLRDTHRSMIMKATGAKVRSSGGKGRSRKPIQGVV